jgi:acetoin utilization protein AcuB
MTFIIQSLDSHERMSVDQLFKRPIAEKVQATAPERPVSDKDHPVDEEKGQKHHPAHSAASAYQVVEHLPKTATVLFAEQIMTAPVIALPLQSRISNALEIFQARKFRHLPVVTDDNRLASIVSDRDVMRYLGGFTRDYHQQIPHKANESIEQIMQPRVLAASPNTDVRHIARLFVEQHVGAMPIVLDGELTGIVTRSDILSAVMRHFVLELWA